MAGRYQKIQALLPESRKMLEGCITQQEVEETLELEGARSAHALLKRKRKNCRRSSKTTRPESGEKLAGKQI